MIDAQLLEAHYVGLRFAEPLEQIRQTTAYAVDVERRDFHEPSRVLMHEEARALPSWLHPTQGLSDEVYPPAAARGLAP